MLARNPRSVVIVFAMAACGQGQSVALINPALWLPMQPDPLDPSVTCADRATRLESGLVEIDTTLCSWVTLAQPSLARVREGDLLKLFAFHSELSAAQPGEGHMALWIDEQLMWEVHPSIPSREVIYTDTVVVPMRAPAGSEVRLHISNHGGNSWRFVSLKRE